MDPDSKQNENNKKQRTKSCSEAPKLENRRFPHTHIQTPIFTYTSTRMVHHVAIPKKIQKQTLSALKKDKKAIPLMSIHINPMPLVGLNEDLLGTTLPWSSSGTAPLAPAPMSYDQLADFVGKLVNGSYEVEGLGEP